MQRNREKSGGYQGRRDMGNGEILVKGYRLPVVRLTSSGDLIYSMVTTANNTTLCT